MNKKENWGNARIQVDFKKSLLLAFYVYCHVISSTCAAHLTVIDSLNRFLSGWKRYPPITRLTCIRCNIEPTYSFFSSLPGRSPNGGVACEKSRLSLACLSRLAWRVCSRATFFRSIDFINLDTCTAFERVCVVVKNLKPLIIYFIKIKNSRLVLISQYGPDAQLHQ